jgi:hypothetical protein
MMSVKQYLQQSHNMKMIPNLYIWGQQEQREKSLMMKLEETKFGKLLSLFRSKIIIPLAFQNTEQ